MSAAFGYRLKLLSIQVGKPVTIGTSDAAEPMDREWTTGFFKERIDGPVIAGPLGLDGDGQADLDVHGGPDKAINVYPADHFPAWKTELDVDFPHGAFGENFTTLGGREDGICIGDIFKLGELRLEVTQPREPCWKLARRWRMKDLAARVERTGRTGWYFRVLDGGLIEAPAEFELEARPFPGWTLTEANAVMHRRQTDWRAARELAACPAVSQIWKNALNRRADKREVESTAARLGGNDA